MRNCIELPATYHFLQCKNFIVTVDTLKRGVCAILGKKLVCHAMQSCGSGGGQDESFILSKVLLDDELFNLQINHALGLYSVIGGFASRYGH